MEPYQKATVSELCQNLVPDLCANFDSNIGKKFYISRNFGQCEEFRAAIRYVWIQAYVVNATKNEDILEICDEPNASNVKSSLLESIILVECDKVPGKTTFKGRYCQVLGEIQGIDSSSKIRIRAIKIVDLDQEPVLQQIWQHEVEDFRRMLHKMLKAKSSEK